MIFYYIKAANQGELMAEEAENIENEEFEETNLSGDEIAEEVLKQAESAVGNDAKVEELEAKLASMQDALLRSAADLDNTRKRSEKELQDVGKYAISSFAKDMVNVLENLERTISAIPDEEKDSPLFKGVELTQKELANSLERRDIKQIAPKTGDKFDHNLHQAMSQVAEPSVEAGCIVSSMQTGYIIHDRLLRPAMVVVSKGVDAAKHEVDTSA